MVAVRTPRPGKTGNATPEKFQRERSCPRETGVSLIPVKLPLFRPILCFLYPIFLLSRATGCPARPQRSHPTPRTSAGTRRADGIRRGSLALKLRVLRVIRLQSACASAARSLPSEPAGAGTGGKDAPRVVSRVCACVADCANSPRDPRYVSIMRADQRAAPAFLANLL